MRNDVKLGFAIGGVLLAVLIVYVLVVPGGSNTGKQTTIDLNSKKPDGGKVTLEPVPAPQATVPPAAPAGVFTPGAPAAEPAPRSSEVASNEIVDKVVDPAPPAKSKDIDWNKLLNGQALMTETPVSAGTAHAMPKSSISSDVKVTPPLEPETKTAAPISSARTNVDLTSDQTPMDQPDKAVAQAMSNTSGQSSTPAPTPAHGSLAAPSTRPAGAGAVAGRTHLVQSGETLSSISAAAYGSANYWPAIVKANPNLDPNRMRAGTTVILPDLKDVKPGEPQTASGKVAGTSSAAAINPEKQYRVVAGDSMYKISVKLYGNSVDDRENLRCQQAGDR